MPLYEIVLRYPDRDEVRVTDRDPRADGHVRVNGAVWPLIEVIEPDDPRIERRYVAQVQATDA